ncbi:MAG: dTMP kinase [Bacteroidetes bacterium]|nr:dTMP kinase [Bacteroidota bacterium]
MFISFEGIDCSGKSTQIALLAESLRTRGYNVLIVREPGGTVISEHIRSMVLDLNHGEIDSHTELLLFSASRSQLVVERIEPFLADGGIVIADRFHDSTTAYQGYGRGLDIASIQEIHTVATHGIVPDLTFFLDISVEESLLRRSQRAGEVDRMEASNTAFFTRVREGYHTIATSAPRVRIIDGDRQIPVIFDEIRKHTIAILPSLDDKEI